MRTAIFVANDALKGALRRFVRDYHTILNKHYTEFLATEGTAKSIKRYLPKVKILSHGPDWGDHEVVEETRKRTDAGQEVQIFAFLHWQILKHWIFIQNLEAKCLQGNWHWFPTPAVARAYLDAIQKLAAPQEQLRSTNAQLDLEPIQKRLDIIAQDIRELKTHPSYESLSPDFGGVWMSSSLREKYLDMREDKDAISSYMARSLIKDRDSIILDSGTTVVYIPRFLSTAKTDVIVYTHNLLVAPPVVGANICCIFCGGILDREYGAAYLSSEDETRSWLKSFHCHRAILAAAKITFEEGPLVKTTDTKNKVFKKWLIIKCLQEQSQLITAVDWTKFMSKLDQRKRQIWEPVLQKRDWENVLTQKDFLLVTKFPDELDRRPSARLAQDVINKFKRNELNGGMTIISVPPEGPDTEVTARRVS
jgi:DeoR/GlpR family transcriptional regulator of sugar metabolism